MSRKIGRSNSIGSDISRKNSIDSIDSDISRRNSIDSRSHSFDSCSSNLNKIRTYSSDDKDDKDVSNDKERLFIIPIKNNKKHKRREREQNIDNIIAKSPSIQNVIKYLQIFEHQRKETKSNE